MRELLLGCGHRKTKDLTIDGNHNFTDVVTVDINQACSPMVIADLMKLPLPFKDNTFDEIHAYDVLEHLAQQGDYKFFFKEFYEYWRILKHNGLFFASVPKEGTVGAWGDPGHMRIINEGTLTFLSQKQVNEQLGKTKLSDYRYLWNGNFEVGYRNTNESHFHFVLRANKCS